MDWYRVGSLQSGIIEVPLKMLLRGLSVTLRVRRDRGGIERQLISLRGKENRNGGARSPQEFNSEGGLIQNAVNTPKNSRRSVHPEAVCAGNGKERLENQNVKKTFL